MGLTEKCLEALFQAPSWQQAVHLPLHSFTEGCRVMAQGHGLLERDIKPTGLFRNGLVRAEGTERPLPLCSSPLKADPQNVYEILPMQTQETCGRSTHLESTVHSGSLCMHGLEQLLSFSASTSSSIKWDYMTFVQLKLGYHWDAKLEEALQWAGRRCKLFSHLPLPSWASP